MVRGLYTAWTGLKNEQKRLDVIANNVANAATTGFKTEYVTSQSFDDMLKIKVRDRSVNYDRDEKIGKVTLGVKIGEEYTDHAQGSLRQTGNTYDLAIDGSGFFRVRVVDITGAEHIRYTRAGNFTINAEGIIMDADGNRLQGEGGDGDLEEPRETHMHLARLAEDDPPGDGVHQIEHHPQHDNGQQPVAGTQHALPERLPAHVESHQHDHHRDHTDEEKYVVYSLFHD